MSSLRIHRAEAISALVIAFVTAAALSLAAVRSIRIDFMSFALPYLMGVAMVCMAAFYRATGRSENISLTLMSCAIFIFFTNAGAVLNYVLLPTSRPLIDGVLFRMDAAIGFDWGSFSALLSGYPGISKVLSLVYGSSLGQLAVIILLLGFTGRRVALHRFLLVGIFAGCLSIFVWMLAPSFGPSPYVRLDPAVDAGLGRVVDADYGAQLLSLAQYGPDIVAQDNLIGLIAFPSMHTVMAGMSVWFTRRTPAFWPFLLINIAMIPAILVHGGHHLVDVFGGVGLFALMLWLACRLVPEGPGLQAWDQLQVASGGRLIRIASMLPPVFRPNSVPRS